VATLEYLVRAIDQASGTFQKVGLSADVLDRQLSDLSKKVATPTVDLNDKAAAKNLAEFAVKLDRLSARVASPKITMEGLHRAQLDILKLDAQLDALNGKEVDVTVDVNTKRGIFSRLGAGAGGLLSGLQGAAGAGAGGAGGLGALGPFGIGVLIAGAAALAPAGIPLGLGALVGGGGALGALKIGSGAEQKLLSMQQSLQNATTSTTRQHLRAQIAAFQASHADQLQFGGAGHAFTQSLSGTFLDALTSRAPGFSAGPHGQAGGSFLSGLTPILRQVSGFVKSLGPGLGALFRSSLPFISAFVKIMERFAKIILPVATQLLKQFTPYLPMMTKGFILLAQGLAGFLKNLGPGMKDSAIIFVAAAKVTMGLLQLLGVAVSWFAIAIVKTAEGIRWFAKNVPHWFDVMRHETAVIFDGIRHDIAHIWDMIWNNTVGRLQRGIADVNRFLGGLPGKIKSIFSKAGTWLLQAGKDVIQGFWNGLTFIWKKVTGWISGIASWIKAHKGPVHLDATLLEPAGRAIMGGLLRGLLGGFGLVKSFIGGVAGHIGQGIGATSGGIQQLAFQIAKARGWANQWGAINALEMGEAGWNMRAVNPSSGAAGIAQFIQGFGEYYQWGGNPNTAAGQIVAFYNYIASRYGTPGAAYAAWLSRSPHWYGSGLQGGIFSRPTIIGVGERGPERVDVTPLGRSRSGAAVQFGDIHVYNATDEAMLRQKLSFAVVAAGLGS